MTITLIYLIKLLLLPPTSIFVFIILGLIWRRHALGLRISATGMALLWLLSLPIVANFSAKFLERSPVLQKQQIIDFAPQALVVIGGGLSSNADEFQQRYTVNDRTLVRLRYAARLAHETGLPVLVSGGKVLDAPDIAEAQVMAEVLQHEFSTHATWIEASSRNTQENADNSFQLLTQFGIRKIILVTQAYHMPRAYSEFSKVGFQVLAAPTSFIHSLSNVPKVSIFAFLPSTRALHNNFLIAHEIVGLLWYRITNSTM